MMGIFSAVPTCPTVARTLCALPNLSNQPCGLWRQWRMGGTGPRQQPRLANVRAMREDYKPIPGRAADSTPLCPFGEIL